MKTVFITYGDKNYRIKKIILKYQAKRLGFHQAIGFGRNDLDPNFILECEPYISSIRGGGYWIWKPYIIFKQLMKLKENDILAYCDAGCLIEYSNSSVFLEYLNLLQENFVLAFESGQLNNNYINDETLKYFDLLKDDLFLNQIQVEAGVILIRKCKESIELFSEWLSIASEKAFLFSDFSSESTTRKDFIEHRHDQSVFNILFYLKGGTSLKKVPNGHMASPFKTYRISDKQLPIIKQLMWVISYFIKVKIF